MRGDSIRDFYAKGLALLGLSLVAGVGALVDHWPVVQAPDTPAAPALVNEPSADAPRLLAFRIPDVAPSTVSLAGSSSAAPRRSAVAERTAPASRPMPIPAAPVGVVALVPRSHLEIAADLQAPPPGPVLTLSAMTSAPATLLALSSPVSADDESLRFAAASGQPDDNGDWFLTDAFKKTGASIVKGGVKTGASIAGAARAVGSAFKRVWIFEP